MLGGILIILAFKVPVNIEETGMQVSGKITEQMVSQGAIGDLLIICTALIVVLLFGFLMDSHNMLITLVSTYVGWLAVIFFPYESWISKIDMAELWWIKLIVLAVGIFLVSVLLSMTNIFKVFYRINFFTRWWKSIVSAVLYTGLLATIIMSILPINFLTQFSEKSINMFASETGRFMWVILPAVGFLFTRFKKQKPGRPSY